MKQIAALLFAVLFAVVGPCSAEAPPDQVDAFLDRVPNWGEPAEQAARREAIQRQYDHERGIAQRHRSTTREVASAREDALNERKKQSSRTIEEWGRPDSTYTNGDYESRTYHRDDGIYSITTKDGVITDFSSYKTRR